MRRTFTHRLFTHPLAIAAACIAVVASQAAAVALTPGNLIFSGRTGSGSWAVGELTSAGATVQRYTFTSETLDAVVDYRGNIQVLNGRFPTGLVEINPATGARQTRAFAGLSTVGNITYGGLGTLGSYVFVADHATANDGEPRGIVRFDLSGAAPTTRFATDLPDDPIDLTVGLDGKIYTLTRGNAGNAGGTRVDVYDPATLAFERAFDLPAEQRGIAVDANGDVYAAQFHGGPNLYRYSRTGALLDQLPDLVTGALGDVDIAPDGRVVATSPNGDMVLTVRALDTYARVSNGAGYLGVGSFGGIVVPEPTTLATAAGLLAMALRRARPRPARG